MSEWAEAPLHRLTSFQKGRKVETSSEQLPGYERYLGASGLAGLPDGFASTSYAVRASEDDVLMLWDGERSGLVGHGQTGVVASTVSRLSPSGEVTGKFLYYALAHQFEWIQNRRTGSGVPHVPKEIGRILRVRYPRQPLTQQRIAAILTSIDNAIEATEALIEKHQQIKAGLMHDLFTRGVQPTGQLRPPRVSNRSLYVDSPLGPIPRDWDVRPCHLLCEQVIDCKNRTPPERSDGHPVIRTPNVRNGEFADEDLAYTDARSYEIWTSRGKPRPGDIVITREAPVGEVCMIPTRHPDACLGQRMMLYRPDASKILPPFFLYALQSRAVQSRLDLISGGSTVGHVRVGDIRSLWMFVPKSMDEQRVIAEALSAASSRLQSEHASVRKLRAQKLGLMQDLLTGKVRVPAALAAVGHA